MEKTKVLVPIKKILLARNALNELFAEKMSIKNSFLFKQNINIVNQQLLSVDDLKKEMNFEKDEDKKKFLEFIENPIEIEIFQIKIQDLMEDNVKISAEGITHLEGWFLNI
jgi:hypothetical protein